MHSKSEISIALLIIFIVCYVTPKVLKKMGPFSEHGKLCQATWRPHLTHPLNECDFGRNKCTEKNFTCINGNCCPSADIVCSMKSDAGHELQPHEHFGRYAFSVQLNTCFKFSYFGNAGNFNNFLTHRDCIRFCRDHFKDELHNSTN